ncbi:MAG TPA: diiron oxygenase [Micromonosporaceae bacterium]|jgi:hypothetical protein
MTLAADPPHARTEPADREAGADSETGTDRETRTDREAGAERLLTASVRHSYDPTIEIDWTAPHVPGAFWIRPERSSLFGTELWDGLSPAQRIELTKHEVANAACSGIWFETMLMRMFVREYASWDPRSKHAHYALTEIADECRHSIMFGRLVESMGTPVYGPSRREKALAKFLVTTARGAHMYASILIAEEILDALQREIMVDETLQPLIRMVSRIHVVEEARHVRFARDELVRQVAASSPLALAHARIIVGRSALVVSNRFTHPAMYAAVGIDPAAGRAAARANPRFRDTMRWAGSRVVAFLGDQGLIAGPAVAMWKRASLI